MRKSVCEQFFEKYLCEVSNGRGYREHENPAVQFTRDAKAHKYDKLSDEGYELLLQETKDLSEFWLSQPRQKASDILQVALENMDIDKDSIHKMAEILSECYSSSVSAFISEELFQEKVHEKKPVGKPKDPEYTEEAPDLEDVDFEEELSDEELKSPQKIYQWLSKRIYGQQDAVKAAAMLLYNHLRGRKRNVLFIGQTGSGKTEIWRVCQQLYPNIRIIDSTMITGEGWVGSFKVTNIFDDMSRREAEEAIFVFDEFDKLCEPQIGGHGSNYSHLLQNELLKLIEGTTISIKGNKIDTSKISFVFCGSFERLTKQKTENEALTSIGFGSQPGKKDAFLVYKDVLQPSDLVAYSGMRQEIAGRIHQIVQLSPMTASAYEAILKDDLMSPLHQLERQYGIKLSLDRNTEQILVQEAEETRMGVRYLRSRIQQMLDEEMFRDCEQTEYKLSA